MIINNDQCDKKITLFIFSSCDAGQRIDFKNRYENAVGVMCFMYKNIHIVFFVSYRSRPEWRLPARRWFRFIDYGIELRTYL